MNKAFKILFLVIILVFSAFLISTMKLEYSEIALPVPEMKNPVQNATSSAFGNNIETIKPKQAATPFPAPKILLPSPIAEVSSKTFEEIINSSVIQLYCGYLNEDGTNFSDISRGTGIIIDSKGDILTNRHIIYDENFKKIRTDCFVLKSPFPNSRSEKPKIYYTIQVINYPSQEKISEVFSKDKYYNDFAILKIGEKLGGSPPEADPPLADKINLLLQVDYASEADYAVLQSSTSTFNYLPIDWNYQPQNDDILITLGYGIDASHIANQITSTVGRLAGNIDINKTGKAQILLIESNATSGFSGGALINPKSKGLIGLISWITSGDITGKYTVVIFRDFLKDMMMGELDFNLKSL